MIIGAATALPLAARAAEAAPSTAGPATTVSGVVVQGEVVTTAPRSVALSVPFAESTITSSDMRNLAPSANLQTLLNNQPSIFAYSNGPNGVGTSIFFRAFNSGQFAETYNGVAINDIFNGGVTGQADTVTSVLLLPADVDSVILTRGINNPAVNSYNSLGGTINFLPLRPSAEFGGSLIGSYGSFDSYTASATLNTGDFMGLKQLISIDYRDSKGWIPNTPDRNTNIFYSGTYDAPNGNKLSLVGVYDYNNGRTPFQMPVPLLQANGGYYQYPDSVAYEKDRDAQYLIILDYKAQLASNITFDNKVFTGGQNYRRTSYANPIDDESAAQPYELYSQSTGSAYWLYYPSGPTYNPKAVFGSAHAGTDYHFYGYTNWAVGYTPTVTVALPHNTVTIGGNVTYGDLHSREFYYGSYDVPQVDGYNDAWDEHDRRTFASVYGQDEIKLLNDMITLTPGVKYQYAFTSDTDDIAFFYPYGGTVHNQASFVSPTVGLSFKPTNHLSFTAAFGQNIKFPDISAYYNDIPGTTSASGQPAFTPPPVQVKPEHVNDYELGAHFQEAGFSADLSFYREDFSDTFIDSFNETTYNTIVTNGGSSRYQGVEVRLTEDVKLQDWGDLSGYVNFAYNQANFTSSFHTDSNGGNLSNTDGLVTAGEPVGDVPDYLVTAGISWIYQGFRFDAQGRYVGRQYTLNYNTGVIPSGTIANQEIPIHSYFLLDLGLSKTIPLAHPSLWAKQLVLTIRANNVLNKYYFNYADVSTKENYFGANTEFASPGEPRNIMGKIEIDF
jgi:outer membrane receptor protein involved in Fe transport